MRSSDSPERIKVAPAAFAAGTTLLTIATLFSFRPMAATVLAGACLLAAIVVAGYAWSRASLTTARSLAVGVVTAVVVLAVIFGLTIAIQG